MIRYAAPPLPALHERTVAVPLKPQDAGAYTQLQARVANKTTLAACDRMERKEQRRAELRER